MLLRRTIEHVRKQDWFAVALDFVVVVVGVFLGIQLGNWNDERVFDNHERTLLLELRAEIVQGIALTNSWREYLDIVSEAGARSIAYIDSDLPCVDDCWERIIDFFHASQFISTDLNRAVFDEMQRLGLPRTRAVEQQVTAFFAQGAGISANLNERPVYRTIIRELIPHTMLDVLWDGCHDSAGGIERLSRDCLPTRDTGDLQATVDQIRANPRIKPTLNHWTSMTKTMGPYMDGVITAGQRAIDSIDAELGEAQRSVP